MASRARRLPSGEISTRSLPYGYNRAMDLGPDPIPFVPFNPRKPMRIYRRNLPHWRQEGCTYFVTFRQADSVPRAVVSQWIEEDDAWLAAHRIDGNLRDARMQAIYETIPSHERRAFEKRRAHRLHVELDACHGSCILRQPKARRTVQQALLHHDGTRCLCGDFVIMPNHVHGLVQPMPGHELEDLLESVKKFSSRELARTGLKQGRFWQKENYDRIVRNIRELHALRIYIEENPAQARLAPMEFTWVKREWAEDES